MGRNIGRTLEAIGLAIVPLAVIVGATRDALGLTFLGAGVGFALAFVGREITSRATPR